jgi:RNA polymerase sigma-70 factor (ECF subfamily)
MTLQSRKPADELILHLPNLRAYALSLTRSADRADDLVQDTLEKAWRHIDRYTPGTNLRGWLCTILRNTFYSDLRKVRREVPDPDGFFVARLTVSPAHDSVLAMREFLAAFGRLSPEHREALALVGALGFSYAEVAEVTTLAIGTVKSRVCRARARLAELLDLEVGESLLPGPDGSMAPHPPMSAA